MGPLYLLHRLVTVEIGERVATLAVTMLALFPMAIFSGAIYREGLFLLLSVAAFWFARNERWWAAGLCAAAATATRSAGLALIVPLAVLYLLGPRGVGEAERPYLGLPWRSQPGERTYPVRADLLWVCAVPLGFVAFVLAAWAGTGDPRAALDSQQSWGRGWGDLAGLPLGPVAGLVNGTAAAAAGLAAIASDPIARLDPTGYPKSLISVEAFAFLIAACAAAVGALRRLPLAYGAYCVAALLLLLLSFPIDAGAVPLQSLPRFVAVLFPLFIWLAVVLLERGWQRAGVAASTLLLVAYSVKWGTWMWVS